MAHDCDALPADYSAVWVIYVDVLAARYFVTTLRELIGALRVRAAF